MAHEIDTRVSANHKAFTVPTNRDPERWVYIALPWPGGMTTEEWDMLEKVLALYRQACEATP